MHYHLLPNYYTFYDIIIELHIAVSICRASYSASTCHPHAMGSNPPSSLLPLATWRFRRASLYRCTRREIAPWVVTDIFGRRCSLLTLFWIMTPRPFLTMLAANWSMSSLQLPETFKAFHRKGDEFMAALVEGYLSYTSVVVALSRLRNGGS